MKITALFAANMGLSSDFEDAFKIMNSTLIELGETVSAINILQHQLPFFNGENYSAVERIMAEIESADGVIFAGLTLLSAPCSVLQTFLEYFEAPKYSGLLEGKNCMILTSSKNGGERMAVNYLSAVIGDLGGYDPVRICLRDTAGEASSPAVKELIERQSEDFYRILRQSRKFIVPQFRGAGQGQAVIPTVSSDDVSDGRRVQTVKLDELYRKHNLDVLTENQQADINRISQLFARKFVSSSDGAVEQTMIPMQSNFVTPAQKTARQLTQSLTHHFNPHLSQGTVATIQLNITGADGFDGFLLVDGTQCTYVDGMAENNDIIVTADSKIWMDVMGKKLTAQRAFMMGQLKVRGNFVLLTKFDQLFNAVS